MKRWAIAFLIFLAFARASCAQDSGQVSTVTKPGPLPRNVTPAKLIHSELPKYPKDAKKAGISGTVVLKATIAKDGRVKDPEYVSGPEELTDAAIKAVQKWKYQPMLLNGKPVEVSTNISVEFKLNHS